MAALIPRRAVLAGAGALALGQASETRAAESASPAPGVHDLLPDFWRFYDTGVGGGSGGRAQGLDEQFFTPNAAVYQAAAFASGARHGPITATRLTAWLDAFDPLAPAARRVSQMLPDAWREHDGRFKGAFPAFRAKTPAYLMMSLFEFSLDARSWQARPCVFVGVDALVKVAGETPDLPVLLDREAFRLYHAQVDPALWTRATTPPLWIDLWREGLATYVSAKLNPNASTASVLMSPDLAALPPEALRALAVQALAALDTTDPAERHRFLDLGSEGDTPVRSGYLLGYRLAERAGRSLSPDQLARLPAAKVHRFMRNELSQIAHG